MVKRPGPKHPGAKRLGPKRPAAKRPGPKHLVAKLPGRKRQGPKLPGPKSQRWGGGKRIFRKSQFLGQNLGVNSGSGENMHDLK